MALGSQGDWLRPERIAETAPPADGRAALFDLRPLSLGEVLDRTFALYRSRFWLFAGITVVSASVQVIVQAISLTTAHTLMRTVTLGGGPTAVQRFPAVPGFGAMRFGTWIAALLFLMVSAVTQAATSLAMSEVYLHHETSAKAALLIAVKRWYRWIGIALWQAWSMFWVILLAAIPAAILLQLGSRWHNTALTVIGAVLIFLAIFAGLPIGIILYLRNALAVPAAVVEKLTIRPAMRRSKALAAGTKGRIFVVLLIAVCLYWVVGVLESPATLLILFAPRQQHYIAEAITLLISFIGRTVVAPVALIGLTLVYFDQRVRREALDLQLLLEGSRRTGSGAAAGPDAGPGPQTPPVAPEGLAPLG